MLNNINIMGRIANDLELKHTANGISVLSFSIAVDSQYGDADKKTDFFGITAWKQHAVFINEHFKKGQTIIISGYLHNREYEYNERKYTKTEIVVKEVSFSGEKREQPQIDTIDTPDKVRGENFV